MVTAVVRVAQRGMTSESEPVVELLAVSFDGCGISNKAYPWCVCACVYELCHREQYEILI